MRSSPHPANAPPPPRLTGYAVWRGRLVIWAGAGAAAGAIVLFALAVDRAMLFFDAVRIGHPGLALMLTPLGGMAIVWTTRRWFAGSEGSGIPQVIVAEHLAARGELELHGLASWRIATGKIILGCAALACGFSAGREGPSVQVGASIMHGVRRFLPRRFPVSGSDLLLAGGAAGIAAAFNTPLAGIVFAVEELGKRIESRTNGVILSAIVLAGVVSISLMGNYLYFGRPSIADPAGRLVLPVVLTGLAVGALGGAFSRLMLLGSGPWPGRIGEWKRAHPVLLAGLCGLILALLGHFVDPGAFGSGYQATRQAISGEADLSPAYPFVKFAATLASYVSGIPGGIFAPSLAIGGGFGSLASGLHLIPLSQPAWMALAMTAFLAGVTQAPITAFVIVMEMTDGHAMVVSLAAAALLASLSARALSRPVYHALARRILQRRLGAGPG